ncbi:MAG: hypothetical protein ACYDIC_08025 [Desulfobaccales bacterium]
MQLFDQPFKHRQCPGEGVGFARECCYLLSSGTWSDFLAFTQTTLKDPTQPHDPNTNPSLNDPKVGSAYDTTISMFIGEVTTGLLGGFFNSDYQPGGVPPAIKNMVSNDWLNLNPIVAFSKIQPLNPFYNIYAQVIFDASNNTVYGVPDRINKRGRPVGPPFCFK